MTARLAGAVRDARSGAAAVAASGRPVIGIVGRDVPSLLIAAAGAHSFRIAPVECPTEDAHAIMGRAIDRAATLVLAAVLSGELDFLSGLFISRDSDASVRLYYTLQELRRRGRIGLPVQLVDQVHQHRESTITFNITQLARMWDTVERWASTSITADALRSAHANLSVVRAELERMRTHRRAARFSGTAALHGYRIAASLPPAQVVGLLRDAMAEARDGAAPGEFPVFLTGSAPLGDELYRAIEAAGATVVGEDHDWGDPLLSDVLPSRLDENRDALLRELVLARLGGAPASASSTMAARAQATREGIFASGARGLLSVVRPHDEAPAWDWRLQSRLAGVPAVMLRGDAAEDEAQIVTAVESLRAAS
ncbi:2-hydroxyacyl-CoA dehydratase family protein [Parafrigoribacterium soli]|uniref:2-hydroxyacyl-CoA dehydratase family protein n=1 Tax=Parafrigoribacterium soli TaxID=3144663 RepID=UPI0032EF0B9D